jgi:hypothetical protein
VDHRLVQEGAALWVDDVCEGSHGSHLELLLLGLPCQFLTGVGEFVFSDNEQIAKVHPYPLQMMMLLASSFLKGSHLASVFVSHTDLPLRSICLKGRLKV